MSLVAQGVRDGVLFSGVRLEASEIVEEPQGLRVELSGGGGGDRHEPVVLALKPPVVLGHLGAVGPWSPPRQLSEVHSGAILETRCVVLDDIILLVHADDAGKTQILYEY